MIPEGPLLWYVNRSTGLVLLVLLTLAVLLGAFSTRGDAGGRVPRFAVQSLHRNIGLLATVMLTLHVVTAVLDEYVDIRWWQAVVPLSLDYEPLWLALGIVAVDLVVAVVVTSLVRHRMAHRTWWYVHVSTYAAWGLAVLHGILIGTDTGTAWARSIYVASGLLVVVALAVRTTTQHRRPAEARPDVPFATQGGAR